MSGLQDQRILFVDSGGTITDHSLALNSHETGTAALTFNDTSDYLYIATYLPFNHKYFRISTVNGSSATMSAEYWYANEWLSFKDQIDDTDSSGASFGQSGTVYWTIDHDKSWEREEFGSDVTGMTKEGIYWKYWLRISFDATISATLSYIGQKFSNDTLLYQHYPALRASRIQESFESGKSDWDDQHILAAQAIAHDLRARNIIEQPDQILKPHDLRPAAVHKTAFIIYAGLGRAYVDEKAEAHKAYLATLNKSFYDIDKDRDTLLKRSERQQTVRTIGR